MTQRDLISRLADRGEEVLAKFADTPGAARMIEMLNSTRERLDDLQKRVMGLESLERRLDEVEKRLERLDAPSAAPATTTPKPAGTATPPKKAAPKKPAA